MFEMYLVEFISVKSLNCLVIYTIKLEIRI